jgi:hypothetical protein
MSRRLQMVWAGLLLLSAAAVMAGTGYSVACRNKACGFKANVTFGGGMRQAEMTGYCVKCASFVSVDWNRTGPGGRAAAPPITGKVWCPATGRTEPLFKCPKCAQTVMAIGSGEDLKKCPRCGKDNLTVKAEMMFD